MVARLGRSLVSLCGVLLLCVGAAPAHADPIYVIFSGTASGTYPAGGTFTNVPISLIAYADDTEPTDGAGRLFSRSYVWKVDGNIFEGASSDGLIQIMGALGTSEVAANDVHRTPLLRGRIAVDHWSWSHPKPFGPVTPTRDESVGGNDPVVGGILAITALTFTEAQAVRDFDTNSPPTAACQDVTVPTDEGLCSAGASIDAGSSDPDGDPITVTQDPPGRYGLGDTLVTLTVTDDGGASDSCQATVTVEDRAAPVIFCNAPATITPPNAPISFTATAEDNCSVASVEVTGYDCWKTNGAGKRVDKTGSCVVSFDGNTLTVEDSGGVGDHIGWTVTATDGSGNPITMTCSTDVVNPGKGKGKSK